ncbi:hypothetical protein N8198_02465 [Gammaproteobacteria bacterium]|nr:hypothetical protein [Gammaproteobacteria bacterium]
MGNIKMARIKLPIMDRLVKAGYLPAQQGRYVKWSRSNCDYVWFGRKEIQASSNNQGAAIVKSLAGKPDNRLSDDQYGAQDVWYTDGYRGRRFCSHPLELFDAAIIKLTGFMKTRK